MDVDAQTFADLEVFETRAGQPGLFAHLDRTRTSGGRRALKRRFLAPLSLPAEILAVQEALRFIASRKLNFGALPNELETVSWSRYLASNVITLATRKRLAPSRAWLRLWLSDRAVLGELKVGVALTQKLLDRISEVCRDLLQRDPPLALQRMVEELATILRQLGHSPPLQGHARVPLRGRRLLILDGEFRETKRDLLERVMTLLNELEALRAMAQAQEEQAWPFPEFEEGPLHLHAEGLRHPLLKGATPNDLHFDAAHPLVFLTGANMGGKTTLLKASALAVYLAHLGMGTPAARCRLSPFDALFGGLQVYDDLQAGISYFQAETQRFRTLAEVLSSRPATFVIYDEIFRGTNVTDALDACRLVVHALARSGKGLFFIASHLVELGEELRAVPAIQRCTFEAESSQEPPRFDYRLREGVSSQRLGMYVMRQEGVFEALERLAPGSTGC